MVPKAPITSSFAAKPEVMAIVGCQSPNPQEGVVDL